MSHERLRSPDDYSTADVLGIVNGKKPMLETDVKLPAERWAFARSRLERTGDLEDPMVSGVLDIEQALRLMASPVVSGRRERKIERQFQRAAALISCRMLLDFSPREMRAITGVGDDPEQLIRKGCAWIATRLSGASLAECERSFRRMS